MFGPQAAQPTPTRKGDHWLQTFARAADENANVVPSPIVVEPISVQLLPESPATVFVRYLPESAPVFVRSLS